VSGQEEVVAEKVGEQEEIVEPIQELKEIAFAVPEPGKVFKAVVKKIVRAPLAVLIPPERVRDPRIRQRVEERGNRPAIQLEVEVEGMTYRITVPISTAPNSNFYKLMKKAGGRLKVGDTVDVVFNERGFPRLYLI